MAGRNNLPKLELYGLRFEPLIHPVLIEMEMIVRGGQWKKQNGGMAGNGLKFHFKRFIQLVWPEYVWQKWSELQLECYLDYRIIGEIGPASSGKTAAAAIHSLTDYYCFPTSTTILVSSTEREMLEMRVWGEIKKFHRVAQSRFDFIPGNLIESRQRIVTDSKWDAEDGRDFRNGLCGVPCKKGGSYVGLSSYVGIKNKRVRLIADEGHLMPRAYVDAISNLNKNSDFKCVVLGNPKETTDALGIVCEPSAELGGWDGGIDQTPKTKFWPTRFDRGVCLQLTGSDCPNMDVPEGEPPPYPFLITREAIAADIKFYGKDSLQYTMMNEGRMPRGQGLRRVITRAMCLKFGAMEEPIWKNSNQTRIGFMDAAYGATGGDRCVFGELRFGDDVNGTSIIALIETMVVPVSVNETDLPEDQIVNYVKTQCEQRKIVPENFFFDSTGRGSLVGAFARLWSPYIVPVEFGGKPTERLVTTDIRVTCRDYYSKFVSELWYSVSLAIQSGQFRGMTEDMMAEGCMREWGFVGANKIEVEPKEKMKLKTGRSPDLFDALVAGVEGARQRGFQITRLAAKESGIRDNKWKTELKDRMGNVRRNHTLSYS